MHRKLHAVALAALLALGASGCTMERERLEAECASLQTQNEQLQQELEALEKLHYGQDAGGELSSLAAAAKQSEKAAERDLLSHPELIPLEGSLGGTMHYFEDSVKTLMNGTVYVYAEDGHMGIDMIFKNQSGENGSYDWKLVAFDMGGGWELAQ